VPSSCSSREEPHLLGLVSWFYFRREVSARRRLPPHTRLRSSCRGREAVSCGSIFSDDLCRCVTSGAGEASKNTPTRPDSAPTWTPS